MRWHKFEEEKPPVSNKFQESDYLLALQRGTREPFVGWYNAKLNSWCVAHINATGEPITNVVYWRELPALPKGFE